VKNEEPRARAQALLIVAAVSALLLAACAGEGDRPATQIVMQYRPSDNPQKTRDCTGEEAADLSLAVDVVKNYWVLPDERSFNLFSGSLKRGLSDVYGVTGPAEYAKLMASNKRVWRKQTYQRAELSDINNQRYARIVLLADWTQESFEGVQTIIFDMTKEDGIWKIVTIFY
jgi:hypothetical protein